MHHYLRIDEWCFDTHQGAFKVLRKNPSCIVSVRTISIIAENLLFKLKYIYIFMQWFKFISFTSEPFGMSFTATTASMKPSTGWNWRGWYCALLRKLWLAATMRFNIKFSTTIRDMRDQTNLCVPRLFCMPSFFHLWEEYQLSLISVFCC